MTLTSNFQIRVTSTNLLSQLTEYKCFVYFLKNILIYIGNNYKYLEYFHAVKGYLLHLYFNFIIVGYVIQYTKLNDLSSYQPTTYGHYYSLPIYFQ